MKVFVTGATGFIGSATVDMLLKDGHIVSGLARTDDGAKKLQDKGVAAVRADLNSLDVLKAEAAKADATVHLAKIHGSVNFELSLQTEFKVLEALLGALEGSNRPLIMTSGTALLKGEKGLLESAWPDQSSFGGRGKAEHITLEGAKRGVRSVVVRLPMFVYDKNGAAFTRVQEEKAKELGTALYVADGTQTVSVVHVEDAAKLYVQALMLAKAGSAYHAVNGTTTAKQLAEGIAAKHQLPMREITQEESLNLYGPFFGRFFGINNVVDSKKTRAELQWEPVHGSDYFLQCIAGKVA